MRALLRRPVRTQAYSPISVGLLSVDPIRRKVDEFSRILKDELTWLFYVSDGTEEFVTSDNPVIVPKQGLVAKPEVVFPISPGICLVARKPKNKSEKSGEIRYVTVPGKRVARTNKQIIASADKEVYTRGRGLTREEAATIGTQVWGERLPVPGVTEGKGLRAAGKVAPSGDEGEAGSVKGVDVGGT